MRSQASGLHAGQRRYHDYSKLRELHQARLLATAAATVSPLSSGSSAFRTSPDTASQTLRLINLPADLSRQTRSFWSSSSTGGGGLSSSLVTAVRNLQLKRLEREANGQADDAALQYRFLAELAPDHPAAVVSRMTHPRFAHYAVNRDGAILYLQTLQRLGGSAVSQLNATELLQRMQRSHSPTDAMAGITAERLQEWNNDLVQQKLSKTDQVPYLLNLLMTGGATAAGSTAATAGVAAGAGAAAGAAAARPYFPPHAGASSAFGGGAGFRGMDPKSPLHVQVSAASGGARGAVLAFVARAALLLVAFSAVGALLDERGIGRGMGMSGGSSKHIQEAAENSQSNVKFDDVKGVEEAKAELEEIVLYLKDPGRFTRLGGKLPRGLLLTGPPGTGKTLLAKAIAGEADVPFFYSSGSQFEEVYVGLGAKRVRELFEAAKTKSPAIIFIDEIDALGGSRKLKDQSALKMTLNELLVQLDGFEENNGIIVIGATNFAESLDKALLRPGRFDKHVTVPLPDVGGRKEILEMYAKKTKLSADVDLSVLARGTTGFSGADLYNLMNQAALKASVDGLNCITMSVLEYAKDKILMGAERKTAVITAETARCTAYHEAGHALVATLTAGANPIHKATIMPRGSALGMVTMLPEGDQTSQSLQEMLAQMDVAMGGRVAEELVFGRNNVTSGAMSDIQGATNVARAMVTKYGFSDAVGIVFHGGSNGEESASAETRSRIDDEVKQLTDAAYQRAKELLTKHAAEHKLLAETLLEYETLTGEEVRDLVHRRKKPNRPVINKEGDGSRGDTSIVDNNSQKKGGRKGRLFGRQQQQQEQQQP